VSGGEFNHSVAPSSGGSLPITGNAPAPPPAPRADIIAPPLVAPFGPRMAPPPFIAPLADAESGSSTSS
jgi:hypothetical protein